ncbi:MAG: hypothetical protein IJZ93_04710 [Clostridia bacterium]|nr:hypothetical protein [Clostridia bacterium]
MVKFIKNMIALSGTAVILGAAGITAYKAFKKHFKISIEFNEDDKENSSIDAFDEKSDELVLDPNDEDLKTLN